MNYFRKLFYKFKGYEVELARSFKTGGVDAPFVGYAENHYILSRKKKVVTHDKMGREISSSVKTELIKIVDKKGNIIIKEGLYIPIYAGKKLFILYNISSSCACFYKYDGTLIRTCEVMGPEDISITKVGSYFTGTQKTYIITNYYLDKDNKDKPLYEEGISKSTLNSEVKKYSDIFDEEGNALFVFVGSLTAYNYFGDPKILSFTKDNKCFLVFDDESVVKCDMIMHVASYGKLPILLGYKEKNKTNIEEEEIFYNFVSMNGTINSDVKIRSISRSDTRSAFRIENNEYKYNYISGETGVLLTSDWYYNATCFSYGRVFAKVSKSSFYKIYDTKGFEIRMPENIRISRIKTNYGYIQKPGKSDGLAIVDVRIYDDTDLHSYIDKEVYIDIHGNIYDL